MWRTLGPVMAGLAVGLGGLGLLSGGDDTGEKESAEVEQARVRAIARGVERVRELRFERLPQVDLVSAKEARTLALSEFDRAVPPARQRAEEEVLKLLGLLRPGDDLRRLFGQIFETEVAGFYVPRSRRLAVVSGQLGGAIGEVVLAHELVHALEDQRFGLLEADRAGSALVADRLAALGALQEGTATVAMVDYAVRRLGLGASRRQILRPLARVAARAGGGSLPPYIEAMLAFPYVVGGRFVDRLERAGGWRAVDAALERPPISTEQVLHPRAFRRREAPRAVALRVGPLLREGWRRVARVSVGEFDTAQVLRLGADARAADRGAKGWAEGAAELWRLGSLPASDCRAPCRPRDVLVAGWRWDTSADAREFAAASRRWLERGLGASRRRGGAWLLVGGAAALASGDRAVVAALAPTPSLATRLARALARRAQVRYHQADPVSRSGP